MSFLAYRPMFDELFDVATSMGLTMTVYVDDVVVSGPGIASRFIQAAQAIIGRYGLCAHKFATSCAGKPRVVTGLQRTASGDSAPSGRFRKIRALETELARATTPERRLVFLRALVGQYREGRAPADFHQLLMLPCDGYRPDGTAEFHPLPVAGLVRTSCVDATP